MKIEIEGNSVDVINILRAMANIPAPEKEQPKNISDGESPSTIDEDKPADVPRTLEPSPETRGRYGPITIDDVPF